MSTWILLRGLTREGRHWGSFPERLREELNLSGTDGSVALIDLPGNGRELASSTPLDIADMVAFVRARAADAGLARPYRLAAMSLGGMVATGWAQRFPEDIDRLVLINTSMRPFSAMHERLRPSAWPALLRVAFKWNDASACETIIHSLTCNRADTRATDIDAWTTIRRHAPVSAANALRQLGAAARFRAHDVKPACPVLLLSSTGDRLVDPVCSRRIATRWDASHSMHPWAGHDLPHDDPAWTSKAIGEWQGALQSASANPALASTKPQTGRPK